MHRLVFEASALESCWRVIIGAGSLSKAAGKIPCHYIPLSLSLPLSPTKYITLSWMITLSSYLRAHSSLVYWKQQVHTPSMGADKKKKKKSSWEMKEVANLSRQGRWLQQGRKLQQHQMTISNTFRVSKGGFLSLSPLCRRRRQRKPRVNPNQTLRNPGTWS